MPLSEEEAKLLHQLEQSLAQEDPAFASALRGTTFAARSRRLVAACAVGFLIGVGVLFAGAVTAQTWLGAAGFLVMVGCAYGFTTAWKRLPTDGPARETPAPKASFVDRMEERWHRRQTGDDR